MDLVKKMKDIDVPPPYEFMSYDVTALFTSVPTNEALEVAAKYLKEDKDLPQTSYFMYA